MKKRSLVLVGGLLLGVGAGLYWSNDRPSVTTAPATRADALDAVPAIVSVQPEFQSTLSSNVEGLVLASSVRPGQLVTKDQLLFEIDPAVYTMELERLVRQLANLREQYALDYESNVTLTRRKEDLDNFEKLTREGSYPELELRRRREEFRIFADQQKKTRLAQEQELATIEHAIQQQKLNIAFCTVRAPAAGMATEILAHAGERVTPRQPLVKLHSSALLVEARINEEDFSGITTGLDASVRFLAYGPQLYSAKVVKVFPSADDQTQQYRAFLEVQIDSARLIPGLSGEASIIRNRRAKSLVIPRTALINSAVFVLDGQTVRLTPVQVGYRGLNAVEILDGLKEGQSVATSRVEALRNGQRVRVNN